MEQFRRFRITRACTSVRHGGTRHDGTGEIAAALVAAILLVLTGCAAERVPTAPLPLEQTAPLPLAAPPTLPATNLDLRPPPVEQPPAVVEVPPEPVERAVPKPAKVAVLVPLSGRATKIGRALRDAAELSLFDNGDDAFLLAFYDTRSDSTAAARVAERAIDEGATLIVGPLFASSAKAVAPIARAAGVPVLAFSNDRSAAGSGIWILGLLPDQQVERVVGFAAASGYYRIGVIVPANAYGAAALSAARNAARAAGAMITREQAYDSGDPDLAELVRGFAGYDIRKAVLDRQRTELRSQDSEIAKRALARLEGRETTGPYPYDAVLVPEGGESVLKLAPLMAYYDVDPREVKYLGTALWADPRLGREPTLVDGWFAAPSPETRAPFVARYRAVYGTAPQGLASLAYDAVGLAAVLARAGTQDAFSAGRLTQPGGFAGVDGLFRLLPDGTNQRGLAIMRVTETGFDVIDPAPRAFAGPIN